MLCTYSSWEGRYLKEFLKPLPGTESRSAVCGYCRPWPFTLLIYSYVLCPLALILYIVILHYQNT